MVPNGKSNTSSCCQLVTAPPEFLSTLVPYQFSIVRLILYSIVCICTGGIFFIITYIWFPQFFTRFARSKLPLETQHAADYVLLHVHSNGWQAQYVEAPVYRLLDKPDLAPTVWFIFKKHRYMFNGKTKMYERYFASVCQSLPDILNYVNSGLSNFEVSARLNLFGRNVVEIEKPSIVVLMMKKLTHPFYIFQVFSCTVWVIVEYTYYAILILVLSAWSMTWEIYSDISNSNRLRQMVESNQSVKVLRSSNGETTEHCVPEWDLVPGDILVLDKGPVIADLLVVSGACVTNEASITGEALPVNKEAAVGKQVITILTARKNFKSSLIYAGSTVNRLRVDSSHKVLAIVLSTGFSTSKGELIRSILYPKKLTFEFERDSYRYLAMLCILALGAFLKKLINGMQNDENFFETLINSLDLVTIAVPPALPLVLSTGVVFALQRLQKRNIFCIDAQRVNSCGQIETFCFDKTGTLTTDSLKLAGVDKVGKSCSFQSICKGEALTLPTELRLAFATCHGLYEDSNSKLHGYSLELAMFEASSYAIAFSSVLGSHENKYLYTVRSPKDKSLEFGIVRRYPFDSTGQKSAVVVQNIHSNELYVFVKGSLEAIKTVCSTRIPTDYDAMRNKHSCEGYYCIGFGYKKLASLSIIDIDDRASVESDLEFAGVAMFTNDLKPESKNVICNLYAAQVDIRIITGDNALTAVHVCRALSMKLKSRIAVIDTYVNTDMGSEKVSVGFQVVDYIIAGINTWEPLNAENLKSILSEYDVAITGSALEKIAMEFTTELLSNLINKVQIFARIRPQQKTWIVEKLMELDGGLRTVGMCGDGANDCGALKAAHVGLALSAAEASLVAPFTSRTKAIEDVPILLREGRCALTTSFLGFKYMVMYPIIQLAMASTLAHVGVALTNNQYMWDDMAIVLSLAMTMLYTCATGKLSKDSPPKTLFSLPIVVSLLGQIILFLIFFALQFYLMQQQFSWFCAYNDGMEYLNDPSSFTGPETCKIYTSFADEDNEFNFEDTCVWLFPHMQYISLAMAFNVGDRFRKPFYTNVLYTLALITTLATNLFLLLDTSDTFKDIFTIMPSIPAQYRLIMLILFLLYTFLCIVWEYFATNILPRLFPTTSTNEEQEETLYAKYP